MYLITVCHNVTQENLTLLCYHSHLVLHNWIDYSLGLPGLVLNNPQVFLLPQDKSSTDFQRILRMHSQKNVFQTCLEAKLLFS